MSAGAGTPEVAVVIPLEDPRGDVVEHLRTWTRRQSLPREHFQVVLSADGRHPDFEQRVAAELASQDQLVSAPGATLMGLYDAGARAARAPVLILTEAHVRAEPGCVAAVAEAFASDPEFDAATLKHLQSATTGISGLSKRWFARCFEAWDRAGWPRLNTTGVAVRSESYLRVGGLDSRLGLYAPSLMSARLHQQGAKIVHLEHAVLTHELESEMGYSLELGADFARGECIVRREQDPEFAERYFGPAGLWERRHAYSPEVSAAMVAALRAAIRRRPRDAPWLSRELVARFPARLAGSRPRRVWERTTTRLNQVVAATPVLPDGLRWRSYVAAHEGNVRVVQLEELARANGGPDPLPATSEPMPAGRLDGPLVGAHGLEREGSRWFRWTEPVALLHLRPAVTGGEVRLDTGGLRGDPLSYLQGAYAGPDPLPPDLIASDGKALRVRLSEHFAGAVQEHGLVLICRPLVPPGDPRRLGMPVVELELSDG
jgi:hypothetical protein